MRTHCKALVVLIAIAVITVSTSAPSQPNLFLWGNVKWNTGYPASGLEVRLIQNSNNTIIGTAYTNQAGRFAFFAIAGRPSDYNLQVYTGNTIRGSTVVPAMPIGGQAPDITIK